MKLILESTAEVGMLEVDGHQVPARIWRGVTRRGVPVLAFIVRVGVPDGFDTAELESELFEPPTFLGEAN